MGSAIGKTGWVLVIAAGAAACVAAGPQQGQRQLARSDGRQCFYSSQVNGFNPVDRDTVHVTVGANAVYELTTFGYCPDINWSQRIAIRSTAGSNWICQGYDAELLVPSLPRDGTLDRCPVNSVRRLSPQEVQAWRSRPRRR